MATCLRVPMATSSSSSQSPGRRNIRCFCSKQSQNSHTPINPQDAFLTKLASVAATSPEMLFNRHVERSVSYNEHPPRSPPPDLPSLLLRGRIVYIGMPLVPAVTELVVAELTYLQWMDPKEPIYIYINSTGTTRDDGETVGMETEGFATYDALMQLKNEQIHTVAGGAAIGQACDATCQSHDSAASCSIIKVDACE